MQCKFFCFVILVQDEKIPVEPQPVATPCRQTHAVPLTPPAPTPPVAPQLSAETPSTESTVGLPEGTGGDEAPAVVETTKDDGDTRKAIGMDVL